uniref:Uncharacterized protein n=1 Tax=viral metagenome TaxID=1070528 RepID=A0A6C0B423_9ZZZZ
MSIKPPSKGMPITTPNNRGSRKSKSPSLSAKSSPSPEPRNDAPLPSKHPRAYLGPKKIINDYTKPSQMQGNSWWQSTQKGGKHKSKKTKTKKNRKTYKKK